MLIPFLLAFFLFSLSDQFINCSSFFYCLLSYWTFYIFFFCNCFYSLYSWILSSVGAKCHPTWGCLIRYLSSMYLTLIDAYSKYTMVLHWVVAVSRWWIFFFLELCKIKNVYSLLSIFWIWFATYHFQVLLWNAMTSQLARFFLYYYILLSYCCFKFVGTWLSGHFLNFAETSAGYGIINKWGLSMTLQQYLFCNFSFTISHLVSLF